MIGERGRGRLMLDRLESNPTKTPWIQEVMAEIAEQLGDRGQALRFLAEGFEIDLTRNEVEGSPWLGRLRTDPAYEVTTRRQD